MIWPNTKVLNVQKAVSNCTDYGVDNRSRNFFYDSRSEVEFGTAFFDRNDLFDAIFFPA